MISLVRICVICVITTLVLCVQINGKPIFQSVYSVLSHFTVPTQNLAESLLGSAFNSSQEYSRKIFNNSVPKMRDAVKSRASAPKRAFAPGGEPKEEILVEEKEQLDDLIKSHH